jgi:hypothetical protein
MHSAKSMAHSVEALYPHPLLHVCLPCTMLGSGPAGRQGVREVAQNRED